MSITIMQCCAGNGKTTLAVNQIKDGKYKTYIFLTKYNSNKNVIEQYIKKECIFSNIVINTLDSFTCSMSNERNQTNKIDYFKNVVINLLQQDQYVSVYKNKQLNENTLIIVDEVQDVPIYYTNALIKIQQQLKFDLMFIGDKYQRLRKVKSIMDDQKCDQEKQLIIRRCKNQNIVSFRNQFLQIQQIIQLQENLFNEKVIIIKQQTYYDHEFYLTSQIIVQQIKQLISKYNYLPEDFLIISPYIKRNNFLQYLCGEINQMFQIKYNTKESYYVIHLSEDDSAINLEPSNNKVRVVSIQSSKGDGRKVVIGVSINKYVLNMFSENDSICYQSLLNVLLTRAKEQMILHFNTNDFDNELNNCEQFSKAPLWQQCTQQDIDSIKLLNQFDKFDDDIEFNKIIDSVQDCFHLKQQNSHTHKTQDYIHCMIRRKALQLTLILQNNNAEILKILSQKKKLIECNTYQYYYRMIQNCQDFIIMKDVNNQIKQDILQLINTDININKLSIKQKILLAYYMEIRQNGQYSDFQFYTLCEIYENWNDNYENYYQDLQNVNNNLIIKPNEFQYTNYIHDSIYINDIKIYSTNTFVSINGNKIIYCISPKIDELNYRKLLVQSLLTSLIGYIQNQDVYIYFISLNQELQLCKIDNKVLDQLFQYFNLQQLDTKQSKFNLQQQILDNQARYQQYNIEIDQTFSHENYKYLSIDTETYFNGKEWIIIQIGWNIFNESGIVKKQQYTLENYNKSPSYKCHRLYNENMKTQTIEYVKKLLLGDFSKVQLIIGHNVFFDIDLIKTQFQIEINIPIQNITNQHITLQQLYRIRLNQEFQAPHFAITDSIAVSEIYLKKQFK